MKGTHEAENIWRRAKPRETSEAQVLTNYKLAFLGEVICRNLQVERGGTLAYTSGNIVMRAMAWAEPTTVFSGLADGDTTKMRADTWAR